jgi:hypothetical protein
VQRLDAEVGVVVVDGGEVEYFFHAPKVAPNPSSAIGFELPNWGSALLCGKNTPLIRMAVADQ